MNAVAEKTADWYAQMLLPLESSIKLTLINKLSASLLDEQEPEKIGISFFDGLTNAWDDGISPEAESESIRAAHTQGKTRRLESL